MLYAVVVDLRAEGDARLPATHGHLGHALFLDLVRQLDPELSRTLHGSGRKPFTVSPLLGTPTPVSGEVLLRHGARAGLRFTLLEDAPFARLLGAIAGPAAPCPRLGEAVFTIEQIHTQATTHPGAGFATQAGLWETVAATPEVAIEFVTPTAFSFGDEGAVLFPLPSLVFGGLLARWHAHGGPAIDDGTRRWLTERVLVSRYRLETAMLDFRRYRKVGFTGVSTFELPAEAPLAARRALHALAEFAFFSGVGYKTTMGMGQTRRVKENRRA